MVPPTSWSSCVGSGRENIEISHLVGVLALYRGNMDSRTEFGDLPFGIANRVCKRGGQKRTFWYCLSALAMPPITSHNSSLAGH